MDTVFPGRGWRQVGGAICTATDCGRMTAHANRASVDTKDLFYPGIAITDMNPLDEPDGFDVSATTCALQVRQFVNEVIRDTQPDIISHAVPCTGRLNVQLHPHGPKEVIADQQ